VAAEHSRGSGPVADGVGSSKPTLPNDASPMAIDEQGAQKVETESSNKLQEQPTMHQKP
jgi:histone deacetylase 1/2